MENSAILIAKFIITYLTSIGAPISNLHLQKMLYFLQRNFIEEFDTTLFGDDIEAWQYGPVTPSVYRVYSGYGAMKIDAMYEEDWDEIIFQNQEQIDYFIARIDALRERDAWDLVEESHRHGGAWDNVYKNGVGAFRQITVDDIRRDINS